MLPPITTIGESSATQDMFKCASLSLSAPGPHLVVNLERFTEENAKTTEYIERLFG